MAIDPIQLTRQLVDIESTTYNEGVAGAFLHEYLTTQRYTVERMSVAQPDRSSTPGAGSGHSRCRPLHPHGHGSTLLRMH